MIANFPNYGQIYMSQYWYGWRDRGNALDEYGLKPA